MLILTSAVSSKILNDFELKDVHLRIGSPLAKYQRYDHFYNYFLHILTVGQAERRALDAKHEFDQCSKLIKSEMARFEQERVDDFKISLQSFLDGMISRQKEVCAAI
jgi:hypothetical protein